MFGDRLRDGRRGAGLLRVDAADAALQAGKLDDDLAHQVGLGVLGGDHGRRQLGGDPHRQALVGGGRHGAGVGSLGGAGGLTGAGRLSDGAGQPLRQLDEPPRLVGERAEPGVKDDLAQPAGHGLQAFVEVAVEGELGVVEPALQDTLVAVGDELGGSRVGVGDVQKRRQQLTGSVFDRPVALVRLHGGDQHLAGQAQVAFVETARVHTGPLGKVDVLLEHAGRVGPAAAKLGGRRIEPLDDQAPALVVVGDHVLLAQVALVVARLIDDHRPAEHAMTL